MSATNAVSERSFSAARRIKTCLHSARSLNYLMLIRTAPTASINVVDVGNDLLQVKTRSLQ